MTDANRVIQEFVDDTPEWKKVSILEGEEPMANDDKSNHLFEGFSYELDEMLDGRERLNMEMKKYERKRGKGVSNSNPSVHPPRGL